MGSGREWWICCSWCVSLTPCRDCDPANRKHVDTDGNAGPIDPLVALEKATSAQTHLTTVQVPRLEALQGVSEHYNSDPYTLSLRVRKKFRDEKKAEKEKTRADDALKDRYALPEGLSLVPEDEDAQAEARREWERGRRELRVSAGETRRRVEAGAVGRALAMDKGSIRMTAAASLRAQVLGGNTRATDPFGLGRRKGVGGHQVGKC
jgi:coiled-coil domain-containing protein 130